MEQFNAVFTQEGDWFIGWVEEVPGAVAQERTLDAARASLKAALRDVLDANRELARLAEAGHEVIREPLTLTACAAATCCATSAIMAASSSAKDRTTQFM